MKPHWPRPLGSNRLRVLPQDNLVPFEPPSDRTREFRVLPGDAALASAKRPWWMRTQSDDFDPPPEAA